MKQHDDDLTKELTADLPQSGRTVLSAALKRIAEEEPPAHLKAKLRDIPKLTSAQTLTSLLSQLRAPLLVPALAALALVVYLPISSITNSSPHHGAERWTSTTIDNDTTIDDDLLALDLFENDLDILEDIL